VNDFGNVNIQDLTSDVYVTDARAMLVPEVLDEIVAAVLPALRAELALDEDRRRDRALDRSAIRLDQG
jgi:hypothetical protein